VALKILFLFIIQLTNESGKEGLLTLRANQSQSHSQSRNQGQGLEDIPPVSHPVRVNHAYTGDADFNRNFETRAICDPVILPNERVVAVTERCDSGVLCTQDSILCDKHQNVKLNQPTNGSRFNDTGDSLLDDDNHITAAAAAAAAGAHSLRVSSNNRVRDVNIDGMHFNCMTCSEYLYGKICHLHTHDCLKLHCDDCTTNYHKLADGDYDKSQTTHRDMMDLLCETCYNTYRGWLGYEMQMILASGVLEEDEYDSQGNLKFKDSSCLQRIRWNPQPGGSCVICYIYDDKTSERLSIEWDSSISSSTTENSLDESIN